MVTKGLKNELRRRAAKERVDHFANEVFLGFFLADGGLINMCFEGVVSFYQSLFEHDLHELECSRIAHIFGSQQFFMHLSDTGLIFFPEDLEYLELTFRWFDRLRRHSMKI